MRNVNVILTYNLVDCNGNKLTLCFGELKSRYDYVCISNADKGYRWRFTGKKIPMPVRSGTWFNGFPADVMLDWLKGNGWYVHTRVNMTTGNAHVYELPKGNDRREEDEKAFREVIRQLHDDGKSVTATRLYCDANGGDMRDAYYAVREICNKP